MMRASFRLAILLLAVCSSVTVSAELKQVQVGGQITILGEYYQNTGPVADGLRYNNIWLRGRAIGVGTGAGNDLFSLFGWDDDGGDLALVTQWTRLHLWADFSDDIAAFIEFDSVEEWGEDFRSNYLTGADGRAASVDDVEIYQAYIELQHLFGTPLQLRMGRQELSFGSEWLVGPNTNGPAPVWGLSFDGVRLTYLAERWTLDAFWTKVTERFDDFGEEDIDFYGLYASCLPREDMVFDIYWLYLRDDFTPDESTGGLVPRWLEDLFGVNDYHTTSLHTVGIRTAGAYGAIDYEGEVAYQFGHAGQVGALFVPLRFGDDDARFNTWGVNMEIGYTLTPLAWQPRLYVAYAYLGGEDHRDVSVADWFESLLNPFYNDHASVSFNRLFSNWSYSGIMDGSDLSNLHIVHVGIQALPAEKIEVAFDVGYFRMAAPFDRPAVPLLPFLTRKSSRELGWETDFNITYNYSEDLYFCVGWDHLFVGEGLEDGSFASSNGLEFNGGPSGDDADYWYMETGISF